MASVNSGTSTLTADSCAGCHRAHTAQGEFLLKADSEQALCLSCHGNGGTGATTDVEWGIQYVPTLAGIRPTVTFNITGVAAGVITTGAAHGFVVGQSVRIVGLTDVTDGDYIVATTPLTTTFTLLGQTPTAAVTGTPTASGADPSQVLGALRDGGFLKARIDHLTPTRLMYQRGWEDGPYNSVPAISTRPRVGVLASSENVNSAHIDLTPGAGDGIADNGIAWGNGTTGNGTVYTVSCVDCHNPHGNGQYRILKPVPGLEAGGLGAEISVPIANTYGNNDTIVTSRQHGFAVGDVVTIATTSDSTLNGTKVVQSVVNGFTIKVANVTSWTLGTLLTAQNLTVDGTGGTIVEATRTVTDSAFDPDLAGVPPYPTKNYTVIAVKGYQGNASTFLLYARDVVAARAAGYVDFVANIATSTTGTNVIVTTMAHGFGVGDTVTPVGVAGLSGAYTVATIPSSTSFTLTGGTISSSGTGGTVSKRVWGSFGATAGDYFHRTVPWNPIRLGSGLISTISACNPLTSAGSETSATGNASACTTMQDAPNGQPATINASSSPLSINGQIAFNDQISTWCSACHTRYYSSTNKNPGTEPASSTLEDIPIASSSGATITIVTYAPTGVRFSGPAYGDRVAFTGAPDATLNTGDWYVVVTGTGTFQVSATLAGTPYVPSSPFVASPVATFTRTYQDSASSWWFPRADGTFKFQHQTTTNRACVTCHVAHGSNAVMSGANSLAVPYPGTVTTSTSSRLLKIDNRGTCQMCHDPTGTLPAGTLTGPAGAAYP